MGAISTPSSSIIEIVWLSMENQYEKNEDALISRSRTVCPVRILVVYNRPPEHWGSGVEEEDEYCLERCGGGYVVDSTPQS